jgi:hypothetical protein
VPFGVMFASSEGAQVTRHQTAAPLLSPILDELYHMLRLASGPLLNQLQSALRPATQPTSKWRSDMAKRSVVVTPGVSVGTNAGVYQEQGPRGGMRDSFATIPENHRAPPTSGKGASWVRIKATPHGHRTK